MDHLFKPLQIWETPVFEKFIKEVNDKSVLDVLDSKVPLSAAFIDFTILLIQQNVVSTSLIGSHKTTEEILKLESQPLKIDWTKEHEVIVLFHAVDEQWITIWADLKKGWITAVDWGDRQAGDMSKDIKNDAINKISAVLTRMAKMSKKELTLKVRRIQNKYPRPLDSDFFIMAAVSAYTVACGLDPFDYIASHKGNIRERIILEYVKHISPDVAAFLESKRKEFIEESKKEQEFIEESKRKEIIESKRKESEDNSGDEHGPKLKRRKAPNYSQWPSITQKTSVDQKQWVDDSFKGGPNDIIDEGLTLKSFRSLKEHGWIAGEVIDKFFSMLQERDKEMQKNRDLDGKSFFCGTYFLLCLQRDVSITGTVKRMDNWDKMYVPVHVGGKHWALVMVSIHEKQLEYYDSLGYDGTRYMETLISYLCETETSSRGYKKLVPEDWRMINAEVPKQNNGKVQEAGVQIIASCCKYWKR
jgi:hypothetical protein